MRKTVIAILSLFALCLMSCMVVVGEDEHQSKKNDDADTVTIIVSQAPTGIAVPAR